MGTHGSTIPRPPHARPFGRRRGRSARRGTPRCGRRRASDPGPRGPHRTVRERHRRRSRTIPARRNTESRLGRTDHQSWYHWVSQTRPPGSTEFPYRRDQRSARQTRPEPWRPESRPRDDRTRHRRRRTPAAVRSVLPAAGRRRRAADPGPDGDPDRACPGDPHAHLWPCHTDAHGVGRRADSVPDTERPDATPAHADAAPGPAGLDDADRP